VHKPIQGLRVINTSGKPGGAALAGISIGAMSVTAIHAQEAKTPPT
jgi:hypothetical protein